MNVRSPKFHVTRVKVVWKEVNPNVHYGANVVVTRYCLTKSVLCRLVSVCVLPETELIKSCLPSF